MIDRYTREVIKKKIKNQRLKPKILEFIKWLLIDIYRVIKYGLKFQEYGVSIYCGRQGDGKTMSMVEYLERMRLKYPDAIICTNFGYVNQTMPMDGWRDLIDIRNGLDGVIFAIDEIQNEYDSMKWKDFPETLLSQVTQQRKQRIKIICSSQVFSRVVKQLREQCFEVIECKTLANRWTFTKAFDALEYNECVDKQVLKNNLHRLWRYNFIQTDQLRNLYDSYAVVEKLASLDLQPKETRIR